ncbi:MAG: AmmeMemoRadiSam system protein A [Clostridiales Family XIII bacterium]|jgi:AmmeMemoRadiSam system protein A/AmmeMemoRadiSam system protein B|nr:AmmeMemoRadiSam system protein A [Clostridiales Family XIII bacterium]
MLKGCLVPHPPLIIPGVGKGDEIPGTRRAFEEIAAELSAQRPDTVVIFSPHSVLYADYIHISPGESASGNFNAFGAGRIRISAAYDSELASRIEACVAGQGIPAGTLGEKDRALDHGVLVPLYFLKAPRIVRISLSGLSLIDHYRFGMCVREAAESLSRSVYLVASGDMSHKLKEDGPYGFAPEGPKHDAYVRDCIQKSDFRALLSMDPSLCERAAECGLRSIVMLAGAMDGTQVRSRVLCYEGPYGVGYLTAAFAGDGEAPSLLPQLLADKNAALEKIRRGEDALVRLARQTAEHYVRTGKPAALPPGLPEEILSARAGVFVSVKKDGSLRGCIGTIEAAQSNIAMEIMENSVSASARDPRFDPIEPEELDALTYSVDVLSPAEAVDGPGQLDAARYGVIVTKGRRRGLLLPNLDGVDTVEQQISIALQKAGIRPDESYGLERFEVVRHT